ERLDLLLAEAERGEVAVVELLHRVARRADLFVDLEAALQRGAIVGAEDAVEGPVLGGQCRLLGGERRAEADDRGDAESENELTHLWLLHRRAGTRQAPPALEHRGADAGRQRPRPLEPAEARGADEAG